MNNDPSSLEGKCVLVTGAGSGIGQGIATVLAERGAAVVVFDIQPDPARRTCEAIQHAGGQAAWFEGDVRKPGTIRPAIEYAASNFDGVDVLINNAGVDPRKPFLEMTAEDWDHVFDINLKGMFHCTQAVIPGLMEKRRGRIINISSVTFHLGMKHLVHYVASKGGIVGFTRSLARELGEWNITVNCITPGAVDTPRERLIETPEEIEAEVSRQSLRLRVTPRHIAYACLFLASDMGEAITGQTLNVDAGWHMH